MPCTDGRTDGESYRGDFLKIELDEVTELLCFVMQNIEKDEWYRAVFFRSAQDRETTEEELKELLDNIDNE